MVLVLKNDIQHVWAVIKYITDAQSREEDQIITEPGSRNEDPYQATR